MKNKKITIISIMLLSFVTIGCSKQKQTFYKNQLNIISDSENDYVIALTNTMSETNQYSMYKIKEYNECMEIIHKKPSYVVDLVRKKKQIRTDNKYFDSIINRVIRKIIFLNVENLLDYYRKN